MASSEKKILVELFKAELKSRRFRKKGGTWWLHGDEFIQVINIQGSQWSKDFYVNLGVYVRCLGDKEFPLEHLCHIRKRLERLVPDVQIVNRLLDMNDENNTKVDRGELLNLLKEYGIPWLDKCCTLNGLAEEVSKGKLMISPKLKKWIESEK